MQINNFLKISMENVNTCAKQPFLYFFVLLYISQKIALHPSLSLIKAAIVNFIFCEWLPAQT